MAWQGPRPATPPIAPALLHLDVRSPLDVHSPDVARVAADIRILLATPVPGGGLIGASPRGARQRRTPSATVPSAASSIALPEPRAASLGSLSLPPSALRAFVECLTALVDEAGADADAARAPAVGWLTGDDAGVGSAELLAAYDAARAARDGALDTLAALDAALGATKAAPHDAAASTAGLSHALSAQLLSPLTSAAVARLDREMGGVASDGRRGVMSRLGAALRRQREATAGVAVALAAVVGARREALHAAEQSVGATEAALEQLRRFVNVEVRAADTNAAGLRPPLSASEADTTRSELRTLAAQRGARLAMEEQEARVAAASRQAELTVAEARAAGDLAVTAAVANAAAAWDAELAAVDAAGYAAIAAATARLGHLQARAELSTLKREVRVLGAAALAAATGGDTGGAGERKRHVYALLSRFYAASLRHAAYAEPLLLLLRGGLDRFLRSPMRTTSAAAEQQPVSSQSGAVAGELASLCSGWRRRHASTAAAAAAPPSSLASSLKSLAASFTSSGGLSLDVADDVGHTQQVITPRALVSERPLPPAFNPPPRPRVDEDDDAFIASLLETLEHVEAVVNRGRAPEAEAACCREHVAAAVAAPVSAMSEATLRVGDYSPALKPSLSEPTLSVEQANNRDAGAGDLCLLSAGVDAGVAAMTSATLLATPNDSVRDGSSSSLPPILRRGDSARLRPAHISFNETVEVAIVTGDAQGSETERSPDTEGPSRPSVSHGLDGFPVSGDIWAQVYSGASMQQPSRRNASQQEPYRRHVLTEQALDSVLSLLGIQPRQP